MVDSSLHRHSRDSSSWFLSSFTMQSCMMTSVSILSLKSSPINLMFPSERLLAVSSASCSSSTSRCFSSWKESRHEFKEVKKHGRNVFLSTAALPQRLTPGLSSSSQWFHHHLYPFRTPSGIGLAAPYGNSQWLPFCPRYRLEAEERTRCIKKWEDCRLFLEYINM